MKNLILFSFLLPFYVQAALVVSGSGIREKKVAFLSVNVYKLTNLLPSEIKIDKAHPMEAIERASNKVLKLNFLRDVDGEKIENSFKESLKNNQVELLTPQIVKTLAALRVDVKEGQTLTLTGEKRAGNLERLTIEGPGGKSSIEGPKLATQLWSIWYGNTEEDSKLTQLKEQLLSGANSPNSL